MSVSAAQADSFFAEVLESNAVWAIRDEGGFPAPRGPGGERAMPFWSKQSRAQKVVEHVAAYEGFEVVELDLNTWRDRWLPGLEKDGLLVGLNWSGDRATGYDLPPADVLRTLEART